ncbi:MAG: hypothetical protein GQ527_12520 [Bacteroidales bacterium]|nr:hypothetical protein [Bacteroidales bacterium]
MNKRLILLISFLFVFRVFYGLASEFWFPDELQIYLIGLKSFTTGTWPFYGPDIVYTNTQISGALQGLLVSIPFYLLKIPEAPTLFLNILSFISLSFLAYYITIRIKGIPTWLIWVLIMTTPWSLYYSTRVINPSYALVFSIPFFIAILDLLPIYKKPFLSVKWAHFIMGITTTFIMQLHLSWVLLIPFSALVFISRIKNPIKKQIGSLSIYVLGLLIGAITIIPTLLLPETQNSSIESNIIFNWENWSSMPLIILRFLSLSSYEMIYILGGTYVKMLEVLKEILWVSPFAIILLILGFIQVTAFIITFFYNKSSEEWRKIKYLTLASILLLYLSFFFSIKGPSSHTFYILLPLSIFYSFYCYQWIISKKAFTLKVLKVAAIIGVVFHFGLGVYNFQYKSLYVDRQKVEQSLQQMDYTILGYRRADGLGYGY